MIVQLAGISFLFQKNKRKIWRGEAQAVAAGAIAWTAAWGGTNAWLLTIAQPSLSWKYPGERRLGDSLHRDCPGPYPQVLISPRILPLLLPMSRSV